MRVFTAAGAAAFCAAAALAPAASAFAAAPAAATTTSASSAAAVAGGWLSRQLVGTAKDHYDYAGFPGHDYGNTADGVLAMDAAKVAQSAAARMTSFLAAGAKDYATGGGYTTHYYAGSIAKLLLVAEAQHVDIHDFGGLDLPKTLTDEEQPDGSYANVDDKSYGSSTVDQSLALIALTATGSSAPDAKAVHWLEGQQCGDGSFQYTPQTTPAATCTDFDTTAYAAQALVAVRSSKATAALDWIAAHENADGGFGTSGSNANSTAVAVQALLAAGRSATRGISWLRAHQEGCSAPSTERGAVSFGKTFDAKTALRATTQAAQAIAGAPLGTMSNAGATDAAPTLPCSSTNTTAARAATHRPAPHRAASAATTGALPARSVATLPRTGPMPVGPTVWVAVQAIVVGAALAAVGRRRRTVG